VHSEVSEIRRSAGKAVRSEEADQQTMSEKPKKRLIIHSNAHRDRTPTAPTQPKRLVGLIEYLEKISEKAETYAFASGFGCAGVILLLCSVIGIVAGGLNAYKGVIDSAILVWAGSAVAAGLGLGALWCAKYLFNEARQIAPVALLTKASLNHLPEIETLVRPSDLPPTHQQAELLRAAPQGIETPPEELLRATLHGTNSEE